MLSGLKSGEKKSLCSYKKKMILAKILAFEFITFFKNHLYIGIVILIIDCAIFPFLAYYVYLLHASQLSHFSLPSK